MSLLSKRVREQPKAPDLLFELGDDIGFPPVAGEPSAHVAYEHAEGADKVTPRLRRRADARELSERCFDARFDRPHEEDFR